MTSLTYGVDSDAVSSQCRDSSCMTDFLTSFKSIVDDKQVATACSGQAGQISHRRADAWGDYRKCKDYLKPITCYSDSDCQNVTWANSVRKNKPQEKQFI